LPFQQVVLELLEELRDCSKHQAQTLDALPIGMV
jgi:hypothetical protein